jgi:hypothetical protein
MNAYRVQTDGADRTFSSVQGCSVASALMTAVLLGAAATNLAGPVRHAPSTTGIQQLGAGKSYAELIVTQNNDLSNELTLAMQEAFDRIADSQQELDAETQELLYANLWALYD